MNPLNQNPRAEQIMQTQQMIQNIFDNTNSRNSRNISGGCRRLLKLSQSPIYNNTPELKCYVTNTLRNKIVNSGTRSNVQLTLELIQCFPNEKNAILQEPEDGQTNTILDILDKAHPDIKNDLIRAGALTYDQARQEKL